MVTWLEGQKRETKISGTVQSATRKCKQWLQRGDGDPVEGGYKDQARFCEI